MPRTEAIPLEIRSLFRLGLELFNGGRFFDAHEALEDAWRESARGSALRRHLQGLVQVAVAFHHQSRENTRGARSVLDRAVRNLAGAEESFPDLDLDRLRTDLAKWQQHFAGAAHSSERPASERPALPCFVVRNSARRKRPS